jgi:hypothetical protein
MIVPGPIPYSLAGTPAPSDWFSTDRIQLANGGWWSYVDPRPEDVNIEDIAIALSREGRFANQTVFPYSVAQHSILVSSMCDPADRFWGLMHDAAEAYCKDLPSPLKHLPGIREAYKAVEGATMRAICERFGLVAVMPESVKRADLVALVTEKRDLMRPTGPLPEHFPAPHGGRIRSWTAREAFTEFMFQFEALGGRR